MAMSSALSASRQRLPTRYPLLHSATTADATSVRVDQNSFEELVGAALASYVNAVRHIPTIEQVRVQQAGAYLHIVSYVSDAAPADRSAIYDAEIALHDAYPQLRFEFNIVDRHGYPTVNSPIAGKFIEHIRTLPDMK